MPRSIRIIALRAAGPASKPRVSIGLALMFALIGHAGAAQNAVSTASRIVEYRALPIDLCVPLDRDTALALDTGRAQLLLRLQNQGFVRRYSPPFNVYLYDTGRRQRTLVHTFAMQSDIASRENAARPVAQTFSIDLHDAALAARKPAPLCIALELERDAAGDREQRQTTRDPGSQHAQAKPTDRLRISLSIRVPTP
jgi:hypothetical protein